MATKVFNKAEAIAELSAANLPQELKIVLLDTVKKATDNSEVTMSYVCKDMFRITFPSTESFNLIKDFGSASIYVSTIRYITTVTVFKEKK